MTRPLLLEAIGIIIVVFPRLLLACDIAPVAVRSSKPTIGPLGTMPTLTAVELLTLDSVALQERLAAGLLSSVDLVNQCPQQIENHDHRGLGLNAMISIVPRRTLMTRSEQLDQERANGRIRSPLHGIPMLVKVGRINRLG